MTRKKLNLAYITNDSMRKATLNKRKKGFIKKIHELSVLCGIRACAVIYSPSSSNPEVWPSHSGVKDIVEEFEMLSEMEQEKKMVNHETFLRQNISKTVENNKKKMKDNADRTMKEAMFHHLGGKGDKLKLTYKNREDLCKYIDQYLKELIHHKNEILNQSNLENGESSSTAATLMATTAIVEVGSSSFPNPNSSRLTSDLWALRPISQRSENMSNFSPTALDQQGYHPMMNSVSVCDQNHPNHNQYQQQFGYSIVSQDEIYNANQNQNQEEEWLVDRIMNYHPKPMEVPTMDDNMSYYHHHP